MTAYENRNLRSYMRLVEVYTKLQSFFDEQDVLNHLETYDYDANIQEEFGISSAEMYDLVPQIASRYRKYLDNDDTWDRMIRYAVIDVVNEYEREKEGGF